LRWVLVIQQVIEVARLEKKLGLDYVFTNCLEIADGKLTAQYFQCGIGRFAVSDRAE